MSVPVVPLRVHPCAPPAPLPSPRGYRSRSVPAALNQVALPPPLSSPPPLSWSFHLCVRSFRSPSCAFTCIPGAAALPPRLSLARSAPAVLILVALPPPMSDFFCLRAHSSQAPQPSRRSLCASLCGLAGHLGARPHLSCCFPIFPDSRCPHD